VLGPGWKYRGNQQASERRDDTTGGEGGEGGGEGGDQWFKTRGEGGRQEYQWHWGDTVTLFPFGENPTRL